jgi:predicted nucleic acid-binding protein
VKEPVYSQALAFESARVASEYKLTTYDASYLALAMFTTSSIASLDTDMVKAARKMGIAITGATL